ncbi:MAG: hypothetical protein KDJ47_02045 [Hyphomicrobiaceae bacterium]|nr:hypothetical protein [Hyphomicrobiaceae bacterium]
MFLFSTTAAIAQIVKISLFFMMLGLPAAHSGVSAELSNITPPTALHDVQRPHSNPRRDRR